MDKKINTNHELLNDKKFWKATVAAVEDDLPSNYIAEVQELLKERGEPEFTNTQISNVKQGRNKGERVIAKAIFEVGVRYKQKEVA
jgi:hypothetical protein